MQPACACFVIKIPQTKTKTRPHLKYGKYKPLLKFLRKIQVKIPCYSPLSLPCLYCMYMCMNVEINVCMHLNEYLFNLIKRHCRGEFYESKFSFCFPQTNANAEELKST